MNEEITSPNVDSLYERYGKPLEQEHYGEYVAITHDGQVITGKDDLEVVDRALQEFGSGNFVFCRIGYRYVDKLRREAW
jgi:hypothetical protein